MSGPITFSVFTKPWKTQSIDELAAFVSETGFDGIEFPLRDGYQAEPADAETALPRLTERMKAYGVAVTSVASVLNEPVFAGCAAAGVPIIRIMMGHDLSADFYDDMAVRLEELHKKLPLCERYGIRVAIQQHYGPGLSNSMELKWFLDQLNSPWVGGIWDSAHSALAGEQPEQALSILWPRLFMANLKNACYRPAESADPATPPFTRYFTTGNQGQASWKRAADYLKAHGYQGVICLTAEYTQEDRVNEYIAADLKLAKSLF